MTDPTAASPPPMPAPTPSPQPAHGPSPTDMHALAGAEQALRDAPDAAARARAAAALALIEARLGAQEREHDAALARPRLERALAHARQALDAADAQPTAAGATDLQRQAHESLWRALKALGRPADALVHCEALLTLAQQRGDAAAPGATLSGPEAEAGADPHADHEAHLATLPPALRALIEQAQQRRKPLALAAFEVIDAAAVRQRHGGPIADAVEREVASLLRMRLRSRDLALSWSGGGWLVALVDTPPAAAAAICERLRLAVQQHDWSYVTPGLQVALALGLVTDAADARPGAVQRARAALRDARAVAR